MFASSHRLQDPHTDTTITDRFSMANKTVLVTGGGRGIGFAICKSIAQLGGNVAVLDTLPSPVEEFNMLAERYAITATYERTDVTVQGSLESSFSRVVEQTGSIEGCVTAAGIAMDRPFFEQTWDECQRILAVNVLGTFWTARLAAEHMIERKKGGSIVLIASIAAQGVKVPLQNLAIYNMSKAAVKGLVGPLAVELGEQGVRVNSISPGVIESPMTAGMKETYPELDDMFVSIVPLMAFVGEMNGLTSRTEQCGTREAERPTLGSDAYDCLSVERRE